MAHEFKEFPDTFNLAYCNILLLEKSYTYEVSSKLDYKFLEEWVFVLNFLFKKQNTDMIRSVNFATSPRTMTGQLVKETVPAHTKQL